MQQITDKCIYGSIRTRGYNDGWLDCITAGADGKLSRMDAQSPVSAQNSQPQQQAQSAHQAFINPTLPPAAAYPNYYYAAGSVLPGGYSYTPTVFPVS